MNLPDTASLLITNAETDSGLCNVLIEDGHIAAIGRDSVPPDGVEVFDAAGGALLPGLNDHHLHLAALAVARHSVACGPPDVMDARSLAGRLQASATAHPGAWIRGIGYHESVAGDIDAAWLDARVPETPVRIQHRGGRLWVFNTAALQRLKVADDDPLERIDGRPTGRLYEGDAWLRRRMQALGEARRPSLAAVSRELASFGITGLTDTTPHNGPDAAAWFEQARRKGQLLQDIQVMGDESLDAAELPEFSGVAVGPHKFHLLESALPHLDDVVEAIRSSHGAARKVAFHCVTRAELVFALAALHEAGTLTGDRIEHASVTPPELLEDIRSLGLTVVTQPGLVYERGDHYLADVDTDDQPWLYRLRAFVDAGVRLAGSSDAPYTTPNPWQAMQAAVDRKTRDGRMLGRQEGLTPEQALALYTSPLDNPGAVAPVLQAGQPANLCLLAQPWRQASADLSAVEVRLTVNRRVLHPHPHG